MKISVVYSSVSGETEQVAELIAEGARLGKEVEVRCMNIDEVDEGFVHASMAVIVGCPTHSGALYWQMKKWIQTHSLKLAGKIGSVFVTDSYIYGRADFAEMELIAHLLALGVLVYSGETAFNPQHMGALVIQDDDIAQQQRARLLGEQVAKKALELFGNG